MQEARGAGGQGAGSAPMLDLSAARSRAALGAPSRERRPSTRMERPPASLLVAGVLGESGPRARPRARPSPAKPSYTKPPRGAAVPGKPPRAKPPRGAAVPGKPPRAKPPREAVVPGKPRRAKPPRAKPPRTKPGKPPRGATIAGADGKVVATAAAMAATAAGDSQRGRAQSESAAVWTDESPPATPTTPSTPSANGGLLGLPGSRENVELAPPETGPILLSVGWNNARKMMRFAKESYVGEMIAAICEKFSLSFADPYMVQVQGGPLMYPDKYVCEYGLANLGRIEVVEGDYPVDGFGRESPEPGLGLDASAERLRKVSMTSLVSEESEESAAVEETADVFLSVEHESVRKLLRFARRASVASAVAAAAAKFGVDACHYGFSGERIGPLDLDKTLGDYNLQMRDLVFLQEGAQLAKTGLDIPEVDGREIMLAFRYNMQEKVLMVKEQLEVRHAVVLASRKFFINKPQLYALSHAGHGVLEPHAQIASFCFGMREVLNLELAVRACEGAAPSSASEGLGPACGRKSFTEDGRDVEGDVVLSVSNQQASVFKIMKFAKACLVGEAAQVAARRLFLEPQGAYLYSHKHGRLEASLPLATYMFSDREEVLLRLGADSGTSSVSGAVGKAAMTSSAGAASKRASVLQDVLAGAAVVVVVMHEPTSRIKMVKAEPGQTVGELVEMLGKKFMLDDVWRYSLTSPRMGVVSDSSALVGSLGLGMQEELSLVINPGAVKPAEAKREERELEPVVGSFFGEPSPLLGGRGRVSLGSSSDDDEGGMEYLRPTAGGELDAAVASSLSPAVLSSFAREAGGGCESYFESGFPDADGVAAERDNGSNGGDGGNAAPSEAGETVAGTPVELFAEAAERALTMAQSVEAEDEDANAAFVADFLLMFRSFIEPIELLQFIMWEMVPGSIPRSELLVRVDPDRGVFNRAGALVLLQEWLSTHFEDFTSDPLLRMSIIQFAHTFLEGAERDCLLALVHCGGEEQQAPLPSYEAEVAGKSIKWHSVWMQTEVSVFAQQMTLLELSLYQRILPRELLDQAWTKDELKNTRAPNVTAVISHFNRFSRWVVTEILMARRPQKRAAIMARFAELAVQLMILKNYSGVMEILSALNSSAVMRLRKTWAKLPPEALTSINNLQVLVSHEKNYKFLRDQLASAKPPSVPYLGLFLSDLVFTADGNPNSTEDGLVNWIKWKQYARIVRALRKPARGALAITPLPVVQHFLTHHLSYIDESDAYDLSLELEPRKKKK
ncbi:Ras protein-specific guanine nucleotide-releasing factor 2 [Thecamonas trahens ATCC 50062]|uniref:Ras protein-specific guanine nucleotide-releasing factor 2 n=1 Tax=Thecamonas trahens ATCC 50062 TaxID=461836 RepID=A0A0L0D9Y2_THETB|nr:Ras protein-specific guanine nucleotide-releasing factor 2 [Thecamonas trahens ATCC 50062]KNC49149.1 Ras protein-specific guanine nucleotide-releasing factor 2 [Thecamonas trahens ATCC 50062]|eukprot:XP_013758171.1 Ras protein-specific guanine nucleotide-releasing factor 2 [Thecamonas trahens ATCC 50062]